MKLLAASTAIVLSILVRHPQEASSFNSGGIRHISRPCRQIQSCFPTTDLGRRDDLLQLKRKHCAASQISLGMGHRNTDAQCNEHDETFTIIEEKFDVYLQEKSLSNAVHFLEEHPDITKYLFNKFISVLKK